MRPQTIKEIQSESEIKEQIFKACYFIQRQEDKELIEIARDLQDARYKLNEQKKYDSQNNKEVAYSIYKEIHTREGIYYLLVE